MPIFVDSRSQPVRDRRATQLRWGAVGAYVLLLGAWLLAGRGVVVGFEQITNVVMMIGPIAALLLCAPAVLAAPRSGARRAALFYLAAASSFTTGQLVWAFYGNVLEIPLPLPSWADACNIVGYACLLSGALSLPWLAAAAAERGRALLDAIASTIAAASFSWYFVISPTIATPHESVAARTLAIAYPLLDLTALCLNLILAGGGRRRGVPALALLALVIPGPIVTVASAIFYVQMAHGTYVVGGLIDLTWPTANMLLAVAAWHLCKARPVPAVAAPVPPDAPVSLDVRPARFTTFLPYLLVPPTVGLAIYASRQDFWELGAVGARTAAIALVGLVLLRQIVALAENERLYARLRRAFAELESSRDAAHGVNDELAVANAQLAEANERLRSLATTDGMTGLPNHRAFQERLREEIARSGRTGEPFALLLIDVDHFKQLNDAFGHPAGDEVLKAVARLLRANVRTADLAARYGGEEFAIICPNATAEGATETAERVRQAIADFTFDPRPVTVSVGVSATDVAGLEAGSLIRSADEALYRSKHRGRDRVTTALVPCGRDGPVAAA